MTIEKDSPARPCGGRLGGVRAMHLQLVWWWGWAAAGLPSSPPSRGSGLGRKHACNKRQTSQQNCCLFLFWKLNVILLVPLALYYYEYMKMQACSTPAPSQ